MGLINRSDELDHLRILVVRYQPKHLYKSLLSYLALKNREHRLAELGITLAEDHLLH